MQRSVSIRERAHALVGVNRDPLENLVLGTPVNVIEVRDRIDIRSRIGFFAIVVFADRDKVLRLIERQRAIYPGVEILVGQSLEGYPRMADLILERFREVLPPGSRTRDLEVLPENG